MRGAGAPAIPTSGTVDPGLAGSIKVNPTADPTQGGNAQLIRDGGISNPGNPAYTYNNGNGASYTDRIQQLISSLGRCALVRPGVADSADRIGFGLRQVVGILARSAEAIVEQ